MNIIKVKYYAGIILLCFFGKYSLAGGGISLQGTRIIYPQESHQQSMSVRNTSTTDSFLVQSWTEDNNGIKSNDIVVTPPLYLSSPGNENILRLILVKQDLPRDRESLYYFTGKAIPSVDEKRDKKTSVIHFAAATRIKLFVRPEGLTPAPEQAPAALSFRQVGGKLEINNPTPYYITLSDIKVGGKRLSGTMISPKSEKLLKYPVSADHHISYNTINDYGVVTEWITVLVH